jgi:hypothetical protein
MDAYAKHLAIAGSLRNQLCELELLTTLTLPTGATQEVANVRRAVCKKVVRKRNSTILTFADVDRAALDQVFPFETFTVGDFPELFVDHVGWRIPQGVGTVTKVPLAWITKTGGTWKYAGAKVIGSAGSVLAVYRGTQPGQGALVDSSEYTVGTVFGAASGVQVVTINFTREQVDFQGRPYVIEADFSLPGTRTPAAEASRILAHYGVTVDSASFDAASTYDTTAGILIDALYGGGQKGRKGIAIIEDLLAAARAWLSPSSTGAWALVQDSPKASSAQFDTAADLVVLEDYGDGDIPKTVTLEYRPRTSGQEDYSGKLSRTTTGRTGDLQLGNPYIRDHTVADKVICYWQKRLNALRVARGTIYAAQLANGAVIDITDSVLWSGTKSFIATGITRPADANNLVLREYDVAIHTYTAGTLPADATNGYSPDLSYTRPAAPTALTVVSQGTSADTDGKVTAYALIRATPPALNWSQLRIQVKDTTTNEIYQAELRLSGANYEATVSGLRPARAHEVVAWAVNANNVEGTVTTAVPFTTANSTTAPDAPVAVSAVQKQSFEILVAWSQVTDVSGRPKVRRYIVLEKVGAGAFTEVARTDALEFPRHVSHGTALQYKIRTEDVNGNESADSTTASITPGKQINDSYIIGEGVGTPSLANSGTTNGKLALTSWSSSGSIAAGLSVSVTLGGHNNLNFYPHTGPSSLQIYAGGDFTNSVRLFNPTGSSVSWSVSGIAMTP